MGTGCIFIKESLTSFLGLVYMNLIGLPLNFSFNPGKENGLGKRHEIWAETWKAMILQTSFCIFPGFSRLSAQIFQKWDSSFPASAA